MKTSSSSPSPSPNIFFKYFEDKIVKKLKKIFCEGEGEEEDDDDEDEDKPKKKHRSKYVALAKLDEERTGLDDNNQFQVVSHNPSSDLDNLFGNI